MPGSLTPRHSSSSSSSSPAFGQVSRFTPHLAARHRLDARSHERQNEAGKASEAGGRVVDGADQRAVRPRAQPDVRRGGARALAGLAAPELHHAPRRCASNPH
eukprot:scaffold98168_cov69-Phaeocystis_antarctica.AAC.3